MRIGIDAANIRTGGGGGITHLIQLLRVAEPRDFGISEVIVWGARSTLEALPRFDWLVPSHQPELDRYLAARFYWQKYRLQELAKAHCDLLFVPGGSYPGEFRPYVTMFRNMLPFDASEAGRYGASWVRMRLAILRYIQTSSFVNADGVIFLNDHARECVRQAAPQLQGKNVVIPHGVEPRLLLAPRQQKTLDYYSMFQPFRLLYVSIVNVYKHQWTVAEAISRLRRRGYPVEIDLVGPAYGPALRRLNKTLNRVDPASAFIHYLGGREYSELAELYHNSDAFVFASSCENMPNILLEAMASGLPIASSNRQPMPSVLGDAGFYFDPDSVGETEKAIEEMMVNVDARYRSAQQAYNEAGKYSWKRCADQTFEFLSRIGRT